MLSIWTSLRFCRLVKFYLSVTIDQITDYSCPLKLRKSTNSKRFRNGSACTDCAGLPGKLLFPDALKSLFTLHNSYHKKVIFPVQNVVHGIQPPFIQNVNGHLTRFFN